MILQRLAADRVDPPELQITIGMLAALPVFTFACRLYPTDRNSFATVTYST